MYQNGNDPESAAEKDELQAELKTLREEIASVAEMVVGHELRQPLLKYMRASTVQAREAQKGWVGYVVSTMQHTIQQLDILLDHATELHSYYLALYQIQSAYDESMAKTSSTEQFSAATPATPSTPNAGNMSRFKDRSVDQALRRFNIAPGKDQRTTISAMLSAVAASRAKLQDQHESAEMLDLEALAKSFDDRDRDLQALLKKLYANSDFGTIRLSDNNLDAQIQDLDEKIADAAGVFAKIDHQLRHEGMPASANNLRSKWS